MLNFLNFNRGPKSTLGVDIGTASIRIVELGRRGQAHELKNYGEIATLFLKRSFNITKEKNATSLSSKEIAKAITAIIKEAKIRTNEVIFSIPDYSCFFTSFALPPMSEKELPQAVRYEARSYVPLPLTEVTLDWSVIEGNVSDKSKTPLKILAVAIPNEIVSQYQEIASLADLEMKAMEAEAFSLARTEQKKEIKSAALIDIGARSTTCNILEKGMLKMSHSFNLSGNELTEVLSRSLKVSYERAEETKREFGMLSEGGLERKSRPALLPIVDSILVEVKKVIQNYYIQEGKGVEKIVLAGGTASLPGLKDYFEAQLNKTVELADPFGGLIFPKILEDLLKEMGPAWTVAVGLALKDLA
jgi:type IV pilus assembly protein PilM